MAFLIPRRHHTKYRNSDGERMGCSWYMWLGKPFFARHYRIF